MTGQVIAITSDELEALHGAGPLAFQAYMMLRAWMDYRTGITGRSRPVSLAMLRAYCETHTTRGAGVQIEQPSEKSIRTALDRLQRAGLLRRLAGDRLAFALPLAAVASARPEQTRHGDGADFSTQPGTAKPKAHAERRTEPGRPSATVTSPNPAHIMNHDFSSSTCVLVDYLHRQDIQTAGRESLIEDWRERGVTMQDLQKAVTTARAMRAKSQSTQPVNAGLLGAILDAGRASTRAPSQNNDSLLAAGAANGCPPRPGESWDAYRRRLAAAVR